MTTTNDTTTAAEKLQGTATWLRDGYKGLAILKRIEAGTIDPTIGSIPVVVRKHGDMLLSLCENGELWICPDGPVGQAFERARIIPAADVDMFTGSSGQWPSQNCATLRRRAKRANPRRLEIRPR